MVDLTLLSQLSDFDDTSEINESVHTAMASFGKDFDHVCVRYWKGIGWNDKLEERIYFHTFDKEGPTTKNLTAYGHLTLTDNGCFDSRFEMKNSNHVTISIKTHLIEQGFTVLG